MEKNNKQKVKSSWRLVIVLSIFFFAVVLIQDVVRESLLVHSELKAFSNNLKDEIEDSVQEKVELRIYDIESFIEQSQSQQQQHLFSTINSVHAALNKSSELLSTETDPILRDELIATTASYATDDILHEYYLIDTDGIMYFDGKLLSEVSIDISSITDVLNSNYYQTLITNILASPEQKGTVNAYILEGSLVTEFKIVGYLIEGTDYIVLTQGASEDFLENQVSNYFSRFGQLYQDADNEILVFRSSGEIIFHNNEDNIGENINTIFASESLQQNVLEAIEISTVGFLIEDVASISIDISDIGYYEYITEADLGIYIIENTDGYNVLLDEFGSNNMAKVIMILVPVYIVLTLLLLVIVRKILKNIKLSEQVFKEEEELYKTLANNTDNFIIITNKQGDIRYLNDLARITIYDDVKEEPINLDQLMVEEDGFKVLIGIENNHYIKYTVLPINYNSQESDLYIINDVTEKVKKERELEALTLQDDLTKLGNRRQMIKDYTEYVLPQIQDGNKGFIVMMDLDNFKSANDSFGHGFGDEVLITISNIFHEVISTNLKVYRVGGDEFAVLATNTTQNTLLSILRKLRNKISNHKYRHDIDISFSGGLVEISIKNAKRRLSDYYEQADDLLYIAKKEGKGITKI